MSPADFFRKFSKKVKKTLDIILLIWYNICSRRDKSPEDGKEEKKMTLTGFYTKINEDGEKKNFKNAGFENTGAKFDDGKAIWRKLRKDGKPSNTFAEQYNPNMPWAFGKWFCEVNSGEVLRDHPELKLDTEKSVTMTHEEYCDMLSAGYKERFEKYARA